MLVFEQFPNIILYCPDVLQVFFIELLGINSFPIQLIDSFGLVETQRDEVCLASELRNFVIVILEKESVVLKDSAGILHQILIKISQVMGQLIQKPIIKIQRQNSHAELFGLHSEQSNDHYSPILKNQKKASNIIFHEDQPPVHKISKPVTVQTQPLGFQRTNFDEYEDFSVKPLNFKEDQSKPVYSSYGYRNFKPISQPTSQPMGINMMKKHIEPARDKIINNRNTFENRVLLTSQGGRWMKGLKQQVYQNPTFMLRSFDKQKSKLKNEYEKIILAFEQTCKKVKQFPFSINVYGTKDLIENELKYYFESKLDKNTIKRQIPSIEWDKQTLKKYFVSYQPTSTQLSYKMISEQPSVNLKKYKNCVYFGGVKNNKKEGFGVLIHYNNKRFEGTYLDDIKSEGLEIEEDEIYFGKFEKGFRDGLGFLKSQSSMCFGEFKNGVFNNQGLVCDSQRLILSLNPTFKIIKNNLGDMYIGEVVNNEKNGIGLEKFYNLDMYIGHYQNNKPEGYGEYYWQNGAIYQGQFLSGLRHGKGRWHIGDGDQYQGEYMNDKKCGEGRYKWRNGTTYKGKFENDYRHGYGEMFWADGTIYKGQWMNGIEVEKTTKKAKHEKKISFISGNTTRNLPSLNTRRSIQGRVRANNRVGRQSIQKHNYGVEEFNRTQRSIPKSDLKTISPNFYFN